MVFEVVIACDNFFYSKSLKNALGEFKFPMRAWYIYFSYIFLYKKIQKKSSRNPFPESVGNSSNC